ncbi:MAG: SCP2 sterol-binding domain-containing protein [Aestuariivita sp.]|nr:SCP2 sterol-binding domain-containing protein [Aestuariivita sp.]
MNEVIQQAINQLNKRLPHGKFQESAKFEILDEGYILLDKDGARIANVDAAVTLRADSNTFYNLFKGSLDPVTAVLSGKLDIDGDMKVAMTLAKALKK